MPLRDNIHGWKDCYKLSYDLFSERADLEFLCGNTSQAEAFIKLAMIHVDPIDDKVSLLLKMTMQRTSSGEYAGAISCGIRCLMLLNVSFYSPSRFHQQQLQLQQLQQQGGGGFGGTSSGVPITPASVSPADSSETHRATA